MAFPALIQIRHGYEAEYSQLRLSVHADGGAWSVRVSDADGAQTLYTAERSGLQAAKVAAAEFALLAAGPIRQSPEAAAAQLSWRERW